MKYVNSLDAQQLNELLNKACSLLISLEEEAMNHNPDYTDTWLADDINHFFNDINRVDKDPNDVVQLERGDDVDWTMQTR